MIDTIELNVVTLDNQEDYIVLDKIEHQNKTYVYLTNEKEILLRKRIKENDEVVLEELENLDEVKLAFSLFFKKHPELLEESPQEWFFLMS